MYTLLLVIVLSGDGVATAQIPLPSREACMSYAEFYNRRQIYKTYNNNFRRVVMYDATCVKG